MDIHEPVDQQPSNLQDDEAHGTVLLVDDEEVVRRLGRASLERRGYQVFLANHGKEAIEIFQSRPRDIDVVILDMTMPVMGGEESLGHLRTIRPDVPVIVCSGYKRSGSDSPLYQSRHRRFSSETLHGIVIDADRAIGYACAIWATEVGAALIDAAQSTGKAPFIRAAQSLSIKMELRGQRIGPMNVFISHASEDRDLANRLAALLEARQIDAWTSARLLPGSDWKIAIQQAVSKAEGFVFF